MWRSLVVVFVTCLACCKSTDPLCSSIAEFEHGGGQTVSAVRGSSVSLACKAFIRLNISDSQCDDHLQWFKDGKPLINSTIYTHNIKGWFTDEGHVYKVNEITFTLAATTDFGDYVCVARNTSAHFTITLYKAPSHTAALVASSVLLMVLALAAVIYSKCRLNFRLWYKNLADDYELNDGKTYDAFVSYVSNESDRKFVNFILKPHLENKYGHKLLLNDTDILPGAEPSAEMIMNMSHSRRLIVVLSQSYLEQAWCKDTFRQGLWHLMELSGKPIFILFDAQGKQMSQEISEQLRHHKRRITTLSWSARSVTPSSGFWKELACVMPRKARFDSRRAGDPQTLLQGDEDPMLTHRPDYLDCRPDPDPAGDLGLCLPIYKTLSSKAPALPVTATKPAEMDPREIASDKYSCRTDFYCLVKEDNT